MRKTTLVVTVALVCNAVAAVPLTGAATGGTDAQSSQAPFAAAQQSANATANASANVTPGAQFMGVVGVQQSEFDGEIAERSFGLRIARAASNESKAAVVGEQVADLRERLIEIEERKQELREARRNGTISESRYRAEISELASETATARRLANATANESAGLPEDLLAANGVNASAIRTLQSNAENLTGPEVAEIARSIAGPNAGNAVGEDRRPDRSDRGADETTENGESASGSEETKTGPETTTAGGEGTTGAETTTDGDETTSRDGSDSSDGGRSTTGSRA